MAKSRSVNVIDHFQVSPPAGSVPTTSLPLTFFDLPWLLCRPTQRLYFYEFPYPTLHFTQNVLPSLKNSLSLTLQQYFPLASNLMCPPSPHKPYILFNNGDSIPFTIVESTLDFDQVIGDHARDVKESHPFVPKLPPTRVTSDGKRVVPLLALQVVVFPNSGICIGAQICHVVADGMAFSHFMKSWASIFRSKEGIACLEESMLPSHDRGEIQDPLELESIFIKEWWNCASSCDYDLMSTHDDQDTLTGMVRVTFKIGQSQIEKLKDLISIQCMESRFNVSTFVVTCALTWVSLIKSQENEASSDVFDNDKIYHFIFVADCRHRLEVKLPTTYFGNCLAICYVAAKKSELVGENGIIMAAKAIGNKVKELESGVFVEAEKWMSKWKEVSEQGRLLAVAGSPKLRVYDTDFGWGRPKKSAVVHIGVSGMYLFESRDRGTGGVEVGLVLPKDRVDIFSGIFENGLKQNQI